MTPQEYFEEIKRFETLKEGWQDIPIERLRREKAGDLLGMAIRLAREMCGEELLRAAYGECDGSDRAETLKMIGYRTHLASFLFAPFAEEPGNLSQVVKETRAVLAGAPPDLFAQMPGRVSQYRIILCKMEALRWDAYLSGIEGITPAERQSAISLAYNRPWETIRKWKEQVSSLVPARDLESRIMLDRIAVKRGRTWRSIRPGETWRDALTRSGERFRDTTNRHGELVEAARKK